ncbi:uncharacterized protein LOC121751426 isoform X1 [Salvia splendens]|uniref:uncharacterized protein LOC121751426 isoform X1 n=1 Tax=Salvia splendens TaxID=180675 RepID=UPI001102444F|nr:uncharacterized protein LOC121751426 isoform X1 [Salvia splendens]
MHLTRLLTTELPVLNLANLGIKSTSTSFGEKVTEELYNVQRLNRQAFPLPGDDMASNIESVEHSHLHAPMEQGPWPPPRIHSSNRPQLVVALLPIWRRSGSKRMSPACILPSELCLMVDESSDVFVSARRNSERRMLECGGNRIEQEYTSSIYDKDNGVCKCFLY